MNNTVKWTIVSGIIIISVAVFYYLVIFIPNNENQKKIILEMASRNNQEMIFREECKDKKKEAFAVMDKLGPEIARVALVRNGYTDTDGNWIDEEVWLKGCVDKKMQFWK